MTAKYKPIADLDDLFKRLIEHQEQQTSRLIRALTKQEQAIMADLSNLTAAVTEDTSVDSSAITLLQNLAAEIEAAKTDPAALQALADQLNANSTALAAAVTANTPAAPAA